MAFSCDTCQAYRISCHELEYTGDVLADTPEKDHCRDDDVLVDNSAGVDIEERDHEHTGRERQQTERSWVCNLSVTDGQGRLSLKSTCVHLRRAMLALALFNRV